MSTIKVDNVLNSTGDQDSGIDLTTNDQIILKTANTTAVTVDSSQNTSIAGDLTIPDKIIHNGDTNTNIRFPANDTITFETGGSERVRVTPSGYLNVGTTSENALFYVEGSENPNMRVHHSQNADEINVILQHEYAQGSQTATMIAFRNSVGNERGTIKTSGTATAYNTSSDYRLKENVNYTFDATTELKKLKPCKFNFIGEKEVVEGFLAHEVSNIVPKAITGEKDAVDSEGEIIPQGIDQSKLVPLLVKTIQELEARITALESK